MLNTIDMWVIAIIAKKIKGRPGSADVDLFSRKATVAKEQQVAPASSREISMLKGMRVIHKKKLKWGPVGSMRVRSPAAVA